MEFFANQSELAFSVAISKNPSTVKLEIHEIIRLFSLQQAKRVLMRAIADRNLR